MSLSLIFLIIAFIVFVLAAVSAPAPPRLNYVALGLAFWLLSILLGSGGIVLK